MRPSDVLEQLAALGVKRGGVLLVHTAFRQIRPIEGGPAGLITALRTALGTDGTLVMPSMSSDDDHPFSAAATPCSDMGIVAETLWRTAGVLRSDSPHAFAAIGPHAQTITAAHPLEVPHGLDSPVGRVYVLNGQVLLLGIGHDANTTIHLAENMAGVRYRRPKSVTILRDGRLTRIEYGEMDHCCENFNLVDDWLDERHFQIKGAVGHGTARLINSRDLVNVVLERLRGNETAFLHPTGVDAECDEARASIPHDA